MKKILKLISVLCIVLIMSMQQAVAETNVLDKPQITFVGVGHSPLVEGDTENFLITTKCDLKVKYRVFLYDDTRKTKVELTEGYTELVDANVPYEVKPSHIFEKGKYRVEIWVKTEGTVSEYDNTYTAFLNCVSRDNKNRVYTNGDMILEKDTYNVGEKVVIQGIKDIAGITGPYKYRLHVFSADKIGNKGFGFDEKGWAKNLTRYEDTIEWIPQEPGTYVLDVHVNTPNSTLWKNVKANKDIIYGGYEAWKLKTITVLGAPLKSVKEEDLKSFLGDNYRATINDSSVIDVNGKLNIAMLGQFSSTGVYKLGPINESFNKDINTQTYNIIKALVDREVMILPCIDRLDGKYIPYNVSIELYSPKMQNRYFMYMLNEQEDSYAPKGTKIQLYIEKLIGSKNTWNDISETHIKNKLEASLKGLFGKEKGYKIYNYILSDYIKNYNTNNKNDRTVTIDNIKINISSEYGYYVSFIF